MSTKHQYLDIKLPKTLTKQERLEVADLVIERIVDRTMKGKDKDGNSFADKTPYSKAYINSLDFENAGKSPGRVDMSLSGDMLAAIQLLQQQEGKIKVGFEKGSEENAKADGNIRGTYGKSRGSKKKARPFLAISKEELKNILDLVVDK